MSTARIMFRHKTCGIPKNALHLRTASRFCPILRAAAPATLLQARTQTRLSAYMHNVAPKKHDIVPEKDPPYASRPVPGIGKCPHSPKIISGIVCHMNMPREHPPIADMILPIRSPDTVMRVNMSVRQAASSSTVTNE